MVGLSLDLRLFFSQFETFLGFFETFLGQFEANLKSFLSCKIIISTFLQFDWRQTGRSE